MSQYTQRIGTTCPRTGVNWQRCLCERCDEHRREAEKWNRILAHENLRVTRGTEAHDRKAQAKRHK